MHAVFLLGSGSSIDAKMHGVKDITKQVISGEGVWLNSENLFVINASSPNYWQYRRPVEPVLALVDDLRGRAADYFGRPPTYEEISLLARQLHDALAHEYESAAVMPLVAELVNRPYVEGVPDLKALSELACHYIADTVGHELSRQPARLDHLGAILEACRQLPRVNLVTLNHDRVLEDALRDAGIIYADGFERTDMDVLPWLNVWHDARVRLLKLHGSLDWWSYAVEDEPWRGRVTARYEGQDVMHAKREGFEWPVDPRPVFLTGTFDKILAYETSVFPDQHVRFHEALREAERVVIGYGFGDKAINTRLISWLARARENSLIVCHRDPDRLAEHARGAIQNKWERWKRDGQLAIIPAHIADLGYETLAAHVAT